VALCGVLGCSGAERVGPSTEREGPASPPASPAGPAGPTMTLENLVSDDVFGGDEHPLVCGAGREFPAGRELLLGNLETREPVHVVFPDAEAAPDDLEGRFVLHGHFQGIQDRSRYTMKRPPEDYRYFVVASWECEK